MTVSLHSLSVKNQGIQKKEFFEEITYMRVVQEACIFLSLGRR